jgi:riboflavin kinase/FMN adenylyltransferase
MNKLTKFETVTALGYFDGLHNGHKAVLRQTLQIAKEKNLQGSVFTFTGGKINKDLLMTAEQKLSALKQFGFNVVFAPDFAEIKGLSPLQFVKEILTGVLHTRTAVCGTDFKFGHNRTADVNVLVKICRETGIEVKIAEPLYCKDGGVAKKISSTIIREKIKAGEISEARSMGFTPEYTLEVIKGRQLARKLNAPTINQQLSPELVVPKYGVYKSETLIDGTFRRSVTNIGVKPTLNEYSGVLSETHILELDEDLYGKVLRVRLLEFIRAEEKFADLDKLKRQINLDKQYAANN